MIKLLIVDDSNVIRSRISRIYSENNSTIQVIGKASNGKSALSLARQHKPDIVTMDLTMPEMNGVECITSLMELDSSIKILVVSALSDKETGILALAKGARGFINKPFTDEALHAALKRLISSKRTFRK